MKAAASANTRQNQNTTHCSRDLARIVGFLRGSGGKSALLGVFQPKFVPLQRLHPLVVMQDRRPRHRQLQPGRQNRGVLRKAHRLLFCMRFPLRRSQSTLGIHLRKLLVGRLERLVEVKNLVLFPIAGRAVFVEKHRKYAKHQQHDEGAEQKPGRRLANNGLGCGHGLGLNKPPAATLASQTGNTGCHRFRLVLGPLPAY